jgi:CRISPR/Cas system CSM-associated protein Csm4 (group 5 of RAMP superfamily)
MSTYSAVLTEVLRLEPDEQLRLISELLVYVRHRFQPKPHRSILELEGLGEEIWHGIDAQEYVNQERNSWHG